MGITRAVALYTESLTLYREFGDKGGIAAIYGKLGVNSRTASRLMEVTSKTDSPSAKISSRSKTMIHGGNSAKKGFYQPQPLKATLISLICIKVEVSDIETS